MDRDDETLLEFSIYCAKHECKSELEYSFLKAVYVLAYYLKRIVDEAKKEHG